MSEVNQNSCEICVSEVSVYVLVMLLHELVMVAQVFISHLSSKLFAIIIKFLYDVAHDAAYGHEFIFSLPSKCLVNTHLVVVLQSQWRTMMDPWI